MTLASWMLLIGGLVALAGGALLLVFGDRMRARDAAAGRIGPKYPTPEAQRRQGLTFVAIGAVAVVLSFLI